MSRMELVAQVAEAGGMSNAEAKRAVDLVLGEIENALQRARSDGKLAIGGFGVFQMAERPARKGRNPRTGATIDIPASRALRFRPAANLKAAAGC